MSCYNRYARYVDEWHDENELKKFKDRRYGKSSKSVLDWVPFRKELNSLGFSDSMLKTAIVEHFGQYNHESKKKQMQNFEELFLHWFTEVKGFNKDQKPEGLYEQVSGIYSETQERISYNKCQEIHTWERVYNLIDYRIQTTIHFDGLLTEILKTKIPEIKKYVRKNAVTKGLSSWYGFDAKKLEDYHTNFRTAKGDINEVRFVDIAKGNIDNLTNKNIEAEKKEFLEWRKKEMSMNDQELKKWLEERGKIYVYDGKGHEPENLIKEYIPTVKQQKAEWKKDLEDIEKKYQDKKWLEFLEVIKA